MNRLADLISRRRIAVAGLVVALCAISMVGLFRLDFDDRPRAILDPDSAEYRKLAELSEQFGSDDNDCLLLVESKQDLFNPTSAAAIRAIDDNLEQLDDVSQVHSLADIYMFLGRWYLPLPALPRSNAPAAFERARRSVPQHPLGGQLLAPDGQSTLIVARLAEHVDNVGQMQAAVDSIRRVANEAVAGTDLSVRMTGIPSIRVELFSTLRRENRKFTTLGIVLTVLMALALFRRPRAVLIVSAGPALGAMWTLGFDGPVRREDQPD